MNKKLNRKALYVRDYNCQFDGNQNVRNKQKKNINFSNLHEQISIDNSRVSMMNEDKNSWYKQKHNYPYGQQNVEITQNVLDRYCADNYLKQSRMLSKFKKNAVKFKQTHKVKKPFYKNIQRQNDKSKYSEKSKKYQQLMTEKEQKIKRQRQKKQLKKIQSMLKDISTKVHENSLILKKGIRYNQPCYCSIRQNRIKKIIETEDLYHSPQVLYYPKKKNRHLLEQYMSQR